MISIRKVQDWALYLFTFSLCFEYWDIFGFKNLSLGAITGYLYAFLFVLNPVFRFKHNEFKRFLIPALVFFIILTIMSIINYNIKSETHWFNASVFQCLLLFILVLAHLSKRTPQIAINVLLSFMFGSILLTILYSFGLGIDFTHDKRIIVFGSGLNGLGFLIAVGILLLLSTIFENQLNFGRQRYLLFLLIPLMLKLIAETGSRGAVISLSVGWLLFVFLLKMKKTFKLLFIIVALASTFYAGQYMLKSDVFRSRIIRTIEIGDTSQRIEIWSSIFPIFIENPIFGVGETGYHDNIPKIFGKNVSPHNVFLEVLIYTGILGFTFFVFLLYKIYFKSHYLFRTYNFSLPLILFVMILTLFMNGQGLFIKIVWLFFAVIISMGITYNIESEEIDP